MLQKKNYLELLERSFPGIKANIARYEALGFSWAAGNLFLHEDKGEVLSHAAFFECPLLVEGQWHSVGALDAICTEVSHRGQGLATRLIRQALEWAEGRCETIILFTDLLSFYERLSFRAIQESRFRLSGPFPKGSHSLRPVIAPQDNDLFLRCFRERQSVSNRLWIKDSGQIASFNALFATYPTYRSIYYSPSIDGFICYRLEEDTLHLLDVVARKMPPLELILNHLPTVVNEVYFYFSPDRFTDKAIPEPYVYDDIHLMVHGPWPCTKPFMISPLSRS